MKPVSLVMFLPGFRHFSVNKPQANATRDLPVDCGRLFVSAVVATEADDLHAWEHLRQHIQAFLRALLKSARTLPCDQHNNTMNTLNLKVGG